MNWLEKNPKTALGIIIVSGIVIILLLTEGLLFLLLANPQWLPESPFVRERFRKIYMNEDWLVFQSDSTLVRYDPRVTYLLKPGPNRYANREFDTHIRANSAGLRDDEASLHTPEIIVLGDSYTMGWGVEEDQTYAAILEKMTGRKVLNAGVSSYATARAMLLLKRLDRSNLRAIVLQYFYNDYWENRSFLENDFQLEVASEVEFMERIREFHRQKRYRPLDYFRAFLNFSNKYPEMQTTPASDIAAACLRIIANSPELHGVPVFFLQIDGWGEGKGMIETAIPELLQNDTRFEALRNNLTVVNVSDTLTRQDYFILDPHLLPIGHQKVAERLANTMKIAGIY